MKYPNMQWGTMEAIVDKLGGGKGALLFLSGELTVSDSTRPWREHNGVITFSVTSDGTGGPLWVTRLQNRGFEIPDIVKSMLYSRDFKATSGITVQVAVLKGILFDDNRRTTRDIRAEGDRRNLKKPNAEIACLIREMCLHDEIATMDLFGIVTMHEPIKDSFGDVDLLRVSGGGNGGLLAACDGGLGEGWRRDNGFAFVVSEVGPEPSAQV
jgi:hypothetical protein